MHLFRKTAATSFCSRACLLSLYRKLGLLRRIIRSLEYDDLRTASNHYSERAAKSNELRVSMLA
jgi:hypothetical protein